MGLFMKFLFAILSFTVLATVDAMEPPEPLDRLKDVEIRLLKVVNGTQGPITIHNENGNTTPLEAGQSRECNKTMVLLTQEELIKMNPYEIEEMAESDHKAQHRKLSPKTSPILSYNEIITLRSEKTKEKLQLTEKEKLNYEPSTTRCSRSYGDSSFYKKFLHFTDQKENNHICFSVSACIDQNELGSASVSLVHNGNTRFNQRTTRYTESFFGQLCTNFSIILEGGKLEKSHIKSGSIPSLYYLCLKSICESKTKTELESLTEPRTPITPKVKEHFKLYLAHLQNDEHQ